MISKVLVANRGEIAIRAFRAAYELGMGTVAVYPVEDRNSAHRAKADESYQIGEAGHPVRAYLNVDEIVATAQACGADAVDGAAAPLAGTTSQPALSSIVAAAANTRYDTGLSLAAVCDLEPYWEALRKVYAPFESGLPDPTGRVYHHEIPGGQLSNLRQQAIALGLGDRFESIEDAFAGADSILGHLVKVTPSSKVVGDLALALVGIGRIAEDFAADPAHYDIPDSVVGFLRGELGDPPGGWPEPLRTKALQGRAAAKPEQTLAGEDGGDLLVVIKRAREA